MIKPAVFISSSPDRSDAAQELAQQLESAAAVTIWSEAAFTLGQTIFESLTEIASRCDFAVFILSPDQPDSVTNVQESPSFFRSIWYFFSGFAEQRDRVFGAPQQQLGRNQLFELGFLAGRLGLSRTFILVPERVSLPADLAGIMSIHLSTRNASDLKATIAPAAAIIRKAMNEIQRRRDHDSTEYYSCFISYSWEDQNFAAQLRHDLSEVGVRSWLDAKEIRTGDQWQESIFKAIQAHDKVLLVLSHSSIQSSWVRYEVRYGLRLEHDRGKTFLFPIRLDDAIFEISGNPEIDSLKERQIGDFRNWQDKSPLPALNEASW